jgi:hypothetical protein
MATTLTQMVARLRQDLHDEDAANQRWTDSSLLRAVAQAVRAYSLALPLAQKTTLTATFGSRDLDLSALADLVRVEAVEWPVDQFPPRYVRFALWGVTLTMLTPEVPNGAESVRVFWGKLHTLTDATQTVASAHEDVIATGAAAFAAIELANYHINLANTGGGEVWRRYLAWGTARRDEFYAALERVGDLAALRPRTLYVPVGAAGSQSRDPGP